MRDMQKKTGVPGEVQGFKAIEQQIADLDNADPHEHGDNFNLICDAADTMTRLLAVARAAESMPFQLLNGLVMIEQQHFDMLVDLLTELKEGGE